MRFAFSHWMLFLKVVNALLRLMLVLLLACFSFPASSYAQAGFEQESASSGSVQISADNAQVDASQIEVCKFTPESSADLLMQEGGLCNYAGVSESQLNGICSILSADSNSYTASEADSFESYIVSQLEACETAIDVSAYNISADSSSIKNAYLSIVETNPQLFFVKTSFTWSYNRLTNTVVDIRPDYFYTGDTLAARKRSFNAEMNKVQAYVAAQSTTLGKVHAAHDWLAANCAYDNSLSAYSAYDALVNKNAVCQGYTLALNAILKVAGVTTTYVKSEAMSHAWSAVNVGGNWYHVDATWDSNKNSTPTFYHVFFMKSSSIFNSTQLGSVGNTSYQHHDWEIVGDYSAISTMYDNYCKLFSDYASSNDKWRTSSNAAEACPDVSSNVQITSASIVSAPTKTAYTSGETFDASGLRVSVTFSNGASYNTNSYYVPDQILSAGQSSARVLVLCGSTSAQVDVPITVTSGNSCTVSFETGEGSAVSTQVVEKGNVATTPDCPTLDGAMFAGWYTDETLTIKYDFSSAVSADIVLYAKWNKNVKRVCGTEARDTAAKIVQEAYPAGSTNDYAILARDDDFMDAMSATGLAGVLDAPIVLTERTSLSSVALAQLKRLQVKTVYIIGGTGAILPEVESSLNSSGIQTQRVWGQEAYDTSYECANKIVELGGSTENVIVASSFSFQDALSMSSYAYKKHAAILIQTYGATSDVRSFCDTQLQLLKEGALKDAHLIVAGGTGAVSDASIALAGRDATDTTKVTRLWGQDAFDTSLAIAKHFVETGGFEAGIITLASGAEAAKGLDALAGAALAGKNSSPVLLVSANAGIENENYTALDGFVSANSSSIESAYVLGGESVMPTSTVGIKVANYVACD